jgi:hypothetical protein
VAKTEKLGQAIECLAPFGRAFCVLTTIQRCEVLDFVEQVSALQYSHLSTFFQGFVAMNRDRDQDGGAEFAIMAVAAFYSH